MTEQTYTVKEISKFMGCHELTVIRWIKRGKLKGFKVMEGKGHWRVNKSEFDRLTGKVSHGV